MSLITTYSAPPPRLLLPLAHAPTGDVAAERMETLRLLAPAALFYTPPNARPRRLALFSSTLRQPLFPSIRPMAPAPIVADILDVLPPLSCCARLHLFLTPLLCIPAGLSEGPGPGSSRDRARRLLTSCFCSPLGPPAPTEDTAAEGMETLLLASWSPPLPYPTSHARTRDDGEEEMNRNMLRHGRATNIPHTRTLLLPIVFIHDTPYS
ncbi:hypothetical protein C8R44DRAFT_990900 [Mycena epipterygia]|nr:hypothetical protein C8R44DRAFT_990900 [Mycena epipterygia]